MENIEEMSLIEVALKLMEEKGCQVNIHNLINEVLKLKGITDDAKIACDLYVDITTSSKFVYMGNDEWDLKLRQSLDQFDKDGASFYSKDDEFVDEEDLDDDLDDEDLDHDEDEEEDYDDEEDLDDDTKSYDDEEPLDIEDDEEHESLDDDFDEDKYNEYMDEYEDEYDN